MKKLPFVFIFILLTCDAFAQTNYQTTNLTSYYPPPTAAYNKISIATNYTIPSINNVDSYASATCTASNSGATFSDNSTPPNYYVCTGLRTYAKANGIVRADPTGTLHVIMNGQDTIYPQECYNTFCSYSTYSTNTCVNNGNPPFTPSIAYPCPTGFTEQVPVDNNKDTYDEFYPTANTAVLSFVCCSGNVSTSLGSPVFTAPSSLTMTLVDSATNIPLNYYYPQQGWVSPTAVEVISPSGQNIPVTTLSFPSFTIQNLPVGTYDVQINLMNTLFNVYTTITSSTQSPLFIPVTSSHLPLLATGNQCSYSMGGIICSSGNCLSNSKCSAGSLCSSNIYESSGACCTAGQVACLDCCCSQLCGSNGKCPAGCGSSST